MVTFQENTSFDRGPYIPFLTPNGFTPSTQIRVGDRVWTGGAWKSVISKTWDSRPLGIKVHSKGGVHQFDSKSEVLVAGYGGQLQFVRADKLTTEHRITHPYLWMPTDEGPQWNLSEDKLWFLGRYLRNGARIDGDHSQQYAFRLSKSLKPVIQAIKDRGQMLIQMSDVSPTTMTVRVIDREFRKVAAALTSRTGIPMVTAELFYQRQHVIQKIMDAAWRGRNGNKNTTKMAIANVNRAYGFHLANLKAYYKMGNLWISPQSKDSYTDCPITVTVSRGRTCTYEKTFGQIYKPIDKIEQVYGIKTLEVKVSGADTVQYGNSLIRC